MNATQWLNRAWRSEGDATHVPQYLMAMPRAGVGHLGLGIRRVIRYQNNTYSIEGQGQTSSLQLPGNPIEVVAELMEAGYPAFWMISPDLSRDVADPELPLIYCIQPETELAICQYSPESQAPGLTAQHVSHMNWETESDESFLRRLSQGIERLQDYEIAKLILTRKYQKEVGNWDAFRLFEIFSGSEKMAACSHFVSMGAALHSLGCSPENVFELKDGRLVFDVVASTRGISEDPEQDARWLASLTQDPKELREHDMAFERYQARMRILCDASTINEEKRHEVLTLGKVRHLYSRISGRLNPDSSWIHVLQGSFPALASYPAELNQFSLAPEPLRFYGGVLGRVSADRQTAAFFLNIRAALVKGKRLFTQGGVGVIRESKAEKELREVENKLRGLMDAVAVWESSFDK